MGQQRKDRELHWRGVIGRQAESDLSVADFCRQESISAPSFYSWRRKLKERDAEPCRKIPRADADSGPQLLPVRIESLEPPGSVRVLLPRGVAIDAPSSIDHSMLADLLRALCESHVC